MVTTLALVSTILSVVTGLKMYWNAPTEVCKKSFNITFPLDEFEIIHNANDKFMGEKITVFYEHKQQANGAWPYFDGFNASKPIGGGLPQLGDLVEHLRIFKQSIEAILPEDFDGPAIIDLEEWKPMLHLNWNEWKVYGEQSIALVRQKHPALSAKALKHTAAKEFNAAAKKWMLETLRYAKSLRPKAKWGYYGFPYCNYDAGDEGRNQCRIHFQRFNDELGWLYAEVIAFYPSIYFFDGSKPAINSIYAQAVLNETKRIRDKFNPKAAIFAYTRFEYSPSEAPELFYEEEDLCNSLRRISDFDLDGGLVWTTSDGLNQQRCEILAGEVTRSFGPYLNLLRKREEECRGSRCSGHGHCVRFEPIQSCDLSLDPTSYSCKCDDGWTGDQCSAENVTQTSEHC